jgi:hypothetical protein
VRFLNCRHFDGYFEKLIGVFELNNGTVNVGCKAFAVVEIHDFDLKFGILFMKFFCG